MTWLKSQMEELHGLHVEVEAESSSGPVREELHVLLFQVVHELLFNVVKHAGTDHATVALREVGSDLILHIGDDGQGFDVEAVQKERSHDGGFGLQNARERLSLFGGTVEIDAALGAGTRVMITVPAEWGDANG